MWILYVLGYLVGIALVIFCLWGLQYMFPGE